jgi:hypothetical protein
MMKHECLDNGLEISFSDGSNRYFGDYHRVCVVATISYALDKLADDDLRLRATAVYGEQIKLEKRLERMGVPSAEVEQTRNALVDDFMRHASTYLSRPDYPRLLIAVELSKQRSGRFYA